MIGLGYHGTVTPSVIRRNVLEDPAWYTAYTPYQPEISQGRLEALLNFQTMVTDLTGLPTAGREPARRGHRRRRGDDRGPPLDQDRAGAAPGRRDAAADHRGGPDPGRAARASRSGSPTTSPTALRETDAFAVVVQTPAADGRLAPDRGAARRSPTLAHEQGALVIAACDLLALTLVTPPGEWGADIAVGSSQRFGVPLFYGGPHAGFMSVRAGLERTLPGRLVGVSRDATAPPPSGSRCRPASSTSAARRRPRTSAPRRSCSPSRPACTPSTTAPTGLRAIAERVHADATALAADLAAAELDAATTRPFFDTADRRRARRGGGGRRARPGARACTCAWSTAAASASRWGRTPRPPTWTRSRAAFGIDHGSTDGTHPHGDLSAYGDLSASARTSTYLQHPVFGTHHSETAMLRYLRALSDRDFALDRGMIPLGSCTMKLNATTEMEPISYDGFAEPAPAGPGRGRAGLRRARRHARGLAGRGHRLRPRLDPAERRQPGRARRPAGHPRPTTRPAATPTAGSA